MRNKARAAAGTSVGHKFENVDLNDARSEYSNYLISELDDEIHKYLPYYEHLIGLSHGRSGVHPGGAQEVF